jgi:3-methyladenine DNA glycosylase/8-oxoguanine DNA glycosylase
MVERRVEIRPRWPFRLPRMLGADGVARRRGTVIHRLVHVDGAPVVVRAAQPARDRVVVGAQGERADLCEEALGRMRFALGVDDDLAPFHERFHDDPLIGPVLRAQPWLRPVRRPDPFEALAWAVTEQLIDYPRAAAIQRRIVWRLGRRCARTDLRDLPTAARLGAQAPAQLQAFDLSAGRSVALVKVSRLVARGTVDLHDPAHERGWRRLREIGGIGSWTTEILAYLGQGRHDVLPAGDLNYVKLVARLKTGNPHERATEDEVRAFFAPYEGWAGLAGTYALRTPVTGPLRASRPTTPAPRPAGTPSSSRDADPLAA